MNENIAELDGAETYMSDNNPQIDTLGIEGVCDKCEPSAPEVEGASTNNSNGETKSLSNKDLIAADKPIKEIENLILIRSR